MERVIAPDISPRKLDKALADRLWAGFTAQVVADCVGIRKVALYETPSTITEAGDEVAEQEMPEPLTTTQ